MEQLTAIESTIKPLPPRSVIRRFETPVPSAPYCRPRPGAEARPVRNSADLSFRSAPKTEVHYASCRLDSIALIKSQEVFTNRAHITAPSQTRMTSMTAL